MKTFDSVLANECQRPCSILAVADFAQEWIPSWFCEQHGEDQKKAHNRPSALLRKIVDQDAMQCHCENYQQAYTRTSSTTHEGKTGLL